MSNDLDISAVPYVSLDEAFRAAYDLDALLAGGARTIPPAMIRRLIDAVYDAHAHAEAYADERDPAAVALGRRGGMKGGPARAKSLTPERRAAIARKAASARWAK